MNKKNHNQKHLTLSDRVYIEQELLQGSTFRSIANVLHKDPSTISKEIRLHAMTSQTTLSRTPRCKQCKHYDSCKMSSLCKMSDCRNLCWSCDYNRYAAECKHYDPFKCHKLSKPPYVCNGCDSRQSCHEYKRYYHATKAQHSYERTLYDSRKDINLTPNELQELNDLISPLVSKRAAIKPHLRCACR